jgi:ribosomal protein S18 acetylase RimI-like enzyme
LRTGEVYGEAKLRDGTGVTLRSARAGDLDMLMKYFNALVFEKQRNPSLGILAAKRATRKDEKKYLDGVLRGIRKNDLADVVATVGDRIVGHCEVRRAPHRDVGHMGRLGIAILEGYRGLGLGSAMLDALLKKSRALGIELVTLEAFATNERALQLYRSKGFKEFGRLPQAIRRGGNPIDLVYMFRQA